MKSKKILLITEIILTLLILIFATQKSVKTIPLNNLQEFSIIENNGERQYFSATVYEKEPLRDLIVQLNSLSLDSDPNLQVFIDESPNFNIQFYCNSDQIGYDICLIPERDIKEGMKIFVEVTCQTACRYSLNLIYKDRIEFNPEKCSEEYILFSEDEAREVLLTLPKMKKGYAYMLIKAEIIMPKIDYTQKAQFDFYGNQGKNQPQKKQDAIFHSIWINEKTRAIIISSQNINVDSDYLFALQVKGPKGAIIQISTVLQDQHRDIKLFDKVSNTVVQKEDVQYFTIDFDNDLYNKKKVFIGEGREQKFATDLIFSLIPYKGDPDLYIHYSEKMPDYDKFDWQSKARFRQDIILISKDDLNEKEFDPKKKIYIAIYGNDLSVFDLKLQKYYNYHIESIPLKLDQPITAFVGKQKLINYQLEVHGNQKSEIEISLTSIQGNPHLFVKTWRKGYGEVDQNITQEEVDTFFNNEDKKHNPFIGWSINQQGVYSVKVAYDPETCGLNSKNDKNNQFNLLPIKPKKYDPSSSCLFSIGVYGHGQQNKYTLRSSSPKPLLIEPIRENRAQSLVLQQSDQIYFSFKPIPLDYEIEQIRFLLNYSSGFVVIRANRDQEQAMKGIYEKGFTISSSNHYIQYTKQDLKQGENLSNFTYFIAVKALEITEEYPKINVEIMRKGLKKIKYTQFITDFPLKLIIEPKSAHYIKFSQSEYNGLMIAAKGDQQIKFYIGEDENNPPTSLVNKYNADKNILSSSYVKIVEIETRLLTDGVYLYGTIENVSDQQTTVIVQEQLEVQLSININFEDILIPNVKRTYFFNIDPQIVSEKMYAYVIAGGTILEQKISGHFYLNNKSVAQFRDNDPIKYFEITSSNLKKECPHLFEEYKWQDCQITIKVQSSQEERINISIISPIRPTQIYDFGSTTSQFPLQDETRKFFYYTEGIQDEFVLSVQSFGYDFQVLAKFINYNQYQSLGACSGNNFPTLEEEAKNLSVYTDPNDFQQIRFHPEIEEGEFCYLGCYLMISIVQPKLSQIDDNKLIGNIIKLSISGFKILVEGDSILGTVNKDEMKFYRIFVPLEQGNMIMVVNLTPLGEGDPDLFLNKDPVKLPTRSEHDLYSQGVAGDFLVINSKTFRGKNISGYYIVGVYGNSKSTFTIQFQIRKYNISKIYKDQIQQVNLVYDQIKYFIYWKSEKGSFTVVTDMDQGNSGDSYLFIKEYGKGKDFLTNLADPNSADKTSKFEPHKEFIRWEEDCDDCTYVIGIKSVAKNLEFSVSINLDGVVAQVQDNKINLIFLKQSIMTKLRFFSQEDFNLYITSYSGYCIKADVQVGFAPQKLIHSKSCNSDIDKNASGQDKFSIFIKHPFRENLLPFTSIRQQNTFIIELVSSYGNEKVSVYVVSSSESRQSTVNVLLLQNLEVQLYYELTNSGDSYLFIKEYCKGKDFLTNLPDPNSADKTTKNEPHKEFIRWEEDCDDCTYVIGIKSVEKNLVFSVFINLDGGVIQIQNNKIHFIFLKQSIMTKLRFFSQNEFNLYVTSYSGYCIKAEIKAGFAPQKVIHSKFCNSDRDKNTQGYDSFSIFIKYPFRESRKPSTRQGQQIIFTIELTSSYGDEKVSVQVISGSQSRLITVSLPLEQEIDPYKKNKTLFSSVVEDL